MSVIAKQIFISELTTQLNDKLTVNEVKAVVSMVTDQLGLYTLERNEQYGRDKEFDELIEVYFDTKRMEGMAESTISNYRYKIKRFRDMDKTPIRELTVYNFRKFLTYEKNRGLADSTLANSRDCYASVFEWLYKEGLLEKNPCGNLSRIKTPKTVKELYSDEDMERLKRVCKSPRDIAILSFFQSSGCRVGEISGMNRDDVDFHTRECKVTGKGSKERIIFIDKITAMYLQEYLATRTDDLPAMFIGKGTERLSEHGMQALIRRLSKSANVTKAYPHRYRTTFATNMIKHGMAIQEVASILGHESLNTTMKYVIMNKDDTHNQYNKYY